MDYHVGGDRERWKSPVSFLLMMCGAGAGVSTVLRLPWVAAWHGGTFFWIYSATVVLVGWPMMLFELGLGQVKQNGAKDGFRKLHKYSSGVGVGAGWLAVVATWCYSSVLSYAVVYFWEGLFTPLPWSVDMGFVARNGTPPVGLDIPRHHFLHDVSEEAEDGVFSLQLFGSLTAVWVMLYYLTHEGTMATQTLVISSFVFTVVSQVWLLLHCAINLDGAFNGMLQFIKPTEPLDLEVVVDGISHGIFACNIGGAVLVAFGSFNEPSRDIVKHSRNVVLITLLASLVVGLASFAVLGNLLETTPHTTIPSLVRSTSSQGYEITFEIYAYATSTMSDTTGNYLAVSLFLSSIMLGMLSLHAWSLALYGMLRDVFSNTPTWVLVGVSCAVAWAGSIMFAFGSIGYSMLSEVDLFLVRGGFPMAVLCQVLVSCYWFTTPRDASARLIEEKVNEAKKQRIPSYWRLVLHSSILVVAVALFGGVAVTFDKTGSYLRAFLAATVLLVYSLAATGTPLLVVHMEGKKSAVDSSIWSDRELTLHNPTNAGTEIHVPT